MKIFQNLELLCLYCIFNSNIAILRLVLGLSKNCQLPVK